MASPAVAEKQVMVVGMDDSEHSTYALEWTLDHFFTPFASNHPFKLVLVHAKPTPSSVVGLAGPGAPEVLPMVEADLKKMATRIIGAAREFCLSKSVHDVIVDVVEGDARNVLCEAVEKHHASILVVGSHGYGPIKRAVLGSVSDYCAHHAHCTVMILLLNWHVLLCSALNDMLIFHQHSTFFQALFTPFASNLIFRLVIVQAKRSPSVSKPGESEEALPYSQADLNRIAALVAERAEEICGCTLVNDVVVKLMQGDARNVLCDAVEKHQASVKVVGSHGYGVIKRAVIGSVSDYCRHNVQCTVMIVKRPKGKN
ncbi:hypothetical protein ACB098_10G113700 [Castanea mollissima]